MIVDFLNNATTPTPQPSLEILRNQEIYLPALHLGLMHSLDQVYCSLTEPEAAYYYQP